MPTAFGRAMLDSIHGNPRQFRMTMQGGHGINLNCREYLTTRTEENQLLDGLNLPEHGTVLDMGCGVGRHLVRVRRNRPNVRCYGIEICELMLDHCRNTIRTPSTFVNSLDEIPNHIQVDLIMLMGNGLGVLGQEQDARVHLGTLVNLLSKTGQIIIETGNPFGHGYVAPNFTVEYTEYQDGPFPWGHSDRKWITQTLQNLDCSVTIHPSQAPGGMFFFAVGHKR